MIKAGIIGGTGYVAGELLRCLVHHPNVEITYVYSHSSAGKTVRDVHTDLFHLNLSFTNSIGEADVVFLCLGHGLSKSFILEHKHLLNKVVIDLSNDFRLKND